MGRVGRECRVYFPAPEKKSVVGRVGRECRVYFPAPEKKCWDSSYGMVHIAIKIMKIINDKNL